MVFVDIMAISPLKHLVFRVCKGHVRSRKWTNGEFPRPENSLNTYRTRECDKTNGLIAGIGLKPGKGDNNKEKERQNDKWFHFQAGVVNYNLQTNILCTSGLL